MNNVKFLPLQRPKQLSDLTISYFEIAKQLRLREDEKTIQLEEINIFIYEGRTDF